MTKIAAFVFFDIETTGLPHQERNKTKITELSFVAAVRSDIEEAPIGSKPYVSKLTLLFNPQKKICAEVALLTGLSNNTLKNAPIFKDNIHTILAFLGELPKPTCLVAHNGNRFDFKLLLTEFLDINAILPQDLLCVDSLIGFRHILKNRSSPDLPNARTVPIPRDKSFSKDDSLLEEDSLARDSSMYRSSSLISEDSLISDDWPELDVSTEDWQEIDSLCSSFSEMPYEASNMSRSMKDEAKELAGKSTTEKVSYTLSSLYRRLLKKEVYNAHRAEDDCLMLLECVVATKEFLPWADRFCKSILDIKPFDRCQYK
ncbi:uncharacterized protein LOC113505206 [Trichoplusia ni]|uniref:Uncharacterized protein LOC113505154 n=1 Tax=Trichoplusia ni TaxID=7111 RepID=A0A7E5WTX0_TRINI|nr:uncharacterized protein LOC113505154 [Trichoplusia ni]XP_026743611.1 uncharacterized protein LOC113505206 [Trichoplusia ni]